MADLCAVCKSDLATRETILAAGGKLYCSKECGVKDYQKIFDKDAEKHFDESAEEVSPKDIGLVKDNNSKVSGRQKIIEILCRRDGCTAEEAKYLIDSAIAQMEETNFDPIDCEEIMMDHLGLEPDYLFDLLLF